ncbi:MAG: transketolase [Lachnospiraceae bacterium]
MTEERVNELEQRCHGYREQLIDLLYRIQTGHPGGSLSSCEIITTLYHEVMTVDGSNPQSEDRDRFILSKGHAAPMLYMNLADKGFFPKEELSTLRQIGSRLQGHPCVHKTSGVELSTGPLGLGLSAGLGMALAIRSKGRTEYVYVVLGDGEIQEGAIWEAAMSAAKYKEDHLIAILDHNGVQLDGTLEEIMPMGDLAAKWRAFGWHVLTCDGHNVRELVETITMAKEHEGSPTIIIASTVKGKGIDFMEGKNIWHGKPISAEEYQAAKNYLGGER